MPEAHRFEDPGFTLQSFLDEPVLVICPRCRRRAQVFRKTAAEVAVTCPSCAYVKAAAFSAAVLQRAGDKYTPTDPYLQLPLWLQEPLGHHILWAFNASHLEYLEAFVTATLRQRTHLSSWQNSSVASRLPRWLSSAAHRTTVLTAIQKLRRKLSSL